MKTIYKYPLLILDEQTIEMPIGAELLTIQMQRGQPVLYALVDMEVFTDKRTISMRGTGHPAGDLGKYISTFQMKDGELVFHVFERY